MIDKETRTITLTERTPVIEIIPGLLGWELFIDGNSVYNFGDLSSEIARHSKRINYVSAMCTDLVDCAIEDMREDDCRLLVYLLSKYRWTIVSLLINRIARED